jgi:hypothetical protein
VAITVCVAASMTLRSPDASLVTKTRTAGIAGAVVVAGAGGAVDAGGFGRFLRATDGDESGDERGEESMACESMTYDHGGHDSAASLQISISDGSHR